MPYPARLPRVKFNWKIVSSVSCACKTVRRCLSFPESAGAEDMAGWWWGWSGGGGQRRVNFGKAVCREPVSHRQGRGQGCSQGPQGDDFAQWECGGSQMGLNLGITSPHWDNPVMHVPPV